ncbi:MAG TPA: hypothetical protein VGJ92_12110 [Methanocella sp.]
MVSYTEAVKAGVVGGILAVVLSILMIGAGLAVTDMMWFMLSVLIICLLLILVMICTGIIAVVLARPHVKSVDDAAMVSVVAGAIAGFIGGGAFVISCELVQLLLQYDFYAHLYRFELPATRDLGSMICGGISCGCLPIVIVGSAILAALSGWIYWLLFAEK